jgi:hypothetical protein
MLCPKAQCSARAVQCDRELGEPLYGTDSYSEFVSKLESAMTALAAEEKLPAWE